MIPNKAIKKINDPFYREILAGILYSYGAVPKTAEGQRLAVKIANEAEYFISVSDLPEWNPDIDDLLIKRFENDAILAIRKTLQEYYGIHTEESVKISPEVKKEINKKISKRLKRSGRKISLKRRSNVYVISPKNPRKDLEDLADDILAEILDEKAFEQEIIEEELEEGTFRVKLPVHIKLPPTFGYMQGDKARWEPEFESDLDAAVYFVGKTPVTTNKPKQQIVADWLLNTLGIPLQELQNHRKKILEKILETINLPGVEEEYPYVYIDTVDSRFESRYAQPEEDEDDFFEDQLDDLLDDIQEIVEDEEEQQDVEELDDELSLEDRMNQAFEQRLDDLLDDVKKPPVPKQPKRRGRKPKKTLPKKAKNKSVKRISSKTLGYSLPKRGQGNSLAEYLNNKIADSFMLAFQANKRNKMLDGPKRPPGFFLRKALLHRFGGDLFNRTVGTLSSKPKDYQDPALSKEERFDASLQDKAPTPKPLPKAETKGAKQLELNLGTMSGSVSYAQSSSPVYDLDARNIVDKYNNQLKKSYDKLGIGFKNLFNNKKEKSVSRSEQDSILYTLPKIFEIIRESLKNSNSTEKQIIKVKGDTLEVIKDAREFEKDSIKESKLESDKDLSSSFDYEPAIGIEDEEDEEEKDLDDQGRPFGWLGDMFDVFDLFDINRNKKKPRSRRRIKGGRPRSTVRKATQRVGTKTPGFLGRIGKKILSTGLGKQATKIFGKGLGKAGLKKLPFGAGAIAGAAFSIERFMRGDIVGGIGEIASGVTAAIPGLGTAVSTGIDAALLARDATMSPKKLASGAIVNSPEEVMIGEAGREAIIPLGNSEAQNIMAMMPMTTGLTVPTILGVTKQIVKNSRTGSQLEPYIEQKIAPLSKIFGIETIAMTSDIGKGMSAVKAQANTQDKKSGGLLDSIKNLFSKVFGGKSSKRSRGIESSSAPNITARGGALGEGQKATAGQLVNGLIRRGFSKEEAAAIVGNLWAESSFNTGALNKTSGAFGLMQWAYGRKDTLIRRAAEAGKQPSDLEFQLDHIAWELRGGHSYETSQFQRAMAYGTDVTSKTRGFAYEVERASSGELSSSMQKRVDAAKDAYDASAQSPQPMLADSPTLNMQPGLNQPISLGNSQPSGQAQSPATVNMNQLPETIRSQVQAGATATPFVMNVFNTPVVTGYNVSKSTPGGGITTIPYDAQGNAWSPELIKKYRLGAN